MAKKRLLLMALIMALLPLSSMRVSAETPDDIDLEAGYNDPSYGEDKSNRAPILIPHVGLDGYTLTFYTPCDGCALRLLDENDAVVYSTVIPSESSLLALPSYLSGTYRIEIVRGAFCFWGYIDL